MQSLLRSLRVFEAVAEHQPVSVGKLARLLEMPKSTVQRMLLTFAEAGWIELDRTESSQWILTSRVITIAHKDRRETGLREVALGYMRSLSDETDETVHLSLLDGIRGMVLIERIECQQAIRTFRALGSTSPMHAGSTGLAALARLPEDKVEEVIGRGLEQFSERTLTDPAELRAELSRIRSRGYSINVCGFRPKVCAIGAAIVDRNGYPVASICITMPDFRFSESKVRGWGKLVADAASAISGRMTI